jgi:predicted transposase YdaD
MGRASHSPVRVRPKALDARYNTANIRAGAHTERWDDAGPVSALLGGGDSLAVFVFVFNVASIVVNRSFQEPVAMAAPDAGFKIAARVSGRQLAALAGVTCDAWAPAVSEVQTTERLADRVFQARRGKQRFLVYMEAYTYWKASAPWSMLSKSGLLSERERLPTVSVVYVLRPRGHRAQGGVFRLAVESQPTQQIWFHEICLWQLTPEPWWERSPGLMALSPLCRQERSPRAVLAHAAEAITLGTSDAIERADLMTTLAIFGNLVYPRIDVAGLIGREQMKGSKIIEEFQEEARQEARLEARREARLEKAREDVLQVLDAKFGAPAQVEFALAMQAETDIDRLNRLLRLAAKTAELKQFRDQFSRT